jgi:hypothetical protein
MALPLSKIASIEHLLTAPRSTTTGKIERFHRSLRAEFLSAHTPFTNLKTAQQALDEWMDYYNNTRPHQALCVVVAEAEEGLIIRRSRVRAPPAPQPKPARQTQFSHSNRLERSLFDVLADNQRGPGGHFPPHPGQMGQRLRNHHPGISIEVHQPLVVGVEHAH